VWADTVVNEEALTRAVSELRKTFDDSDLIAAPGTGPR
jgi:DNA-binding winged helix-turn-helix (wHTH) protein